MMYHIGAVDQSWKRADYFRPNQRRPQKFFQEGKQATYPLSMGSNKTLQLQLGFC